MSSVAAENWQIAGLGEKLSYLQTGFPDFWELLPVVEKNPPAFSRSRPMDLPKSE